MNLTHLRRQTSLLLVVLGLVSGCSEPSKDTIISNMIEGGMSVRSKTMSKSRGVIADYKVYRDGTKDGVVYELTCGPNARTDSPEFTPFAVKRRMVKGLSSEPETKQIMQMGIYTRVIYKTHNGNVITDVKITAADF